MRNLRSLLPAGAALLAALAGGASALLGVCGPFTDTANDAFCPFVLEIFYLGITTGTTATTFSPADNVNRLQMAAFLSRTVDGALRRGSRRAVMHEHWTTGASASLGLSAVGTNPRFVKSDGADLWVSDNDGDRVFRVRGSDGKVLDTWTGANNAFGVLSAMGFVFVAGNTNPGRLYGIDPREPAGEVETVSSTLGTSPNTLAFDGTRIWSANFGGGGSVSIVTPGASIPWTVTTVTAGFNSLTGVLYDGSAIWVANYGGGSLLKLDANGAILQTVTFGGNPVYPGFDGTNIWAPRLADSVVVVRASTGAVLATLTGNGLSIPKAAAFDGQRILVTNEADSVSLWKAADLTPLGSVSMGTMSAPYGACSDGIHFWVVLSLAGRLARF